MNEWKDLEIGNIPSDFFVNERYEIQGKEFYHDDTSFWEDKEGTLEVKLRMVKFSEDFKDNGTQCRYRLKPLEPIRISNNLYDLLTDMDIYQIQSRCSITLREDGTITNIDGRPVEIID